MDINELIRNRLLQVEDLEQRKILRDLMTNVFLKLAEYNEKAHEDLEKRVFEEVEVYEEKLNVFTTVYKRSDYDPLHPFLSPMDINDVEPYIIDMTEAIQLLLDGKSTIISTLFIECDYLILKALANSDRIFVGKIHTDKSSHEVHVRLQQNTKYLKQIEELYNLFLINNFSWRTIHHPYVYKFFDVILEGEASFTLEEDEVVEEINIFLEEFEEYKRVDMVPYWSIKKLPEEITAFPVPAIDRINYEHQIPLNRLGNHHYLVDSDDKSIVYIKRSEDELVIVSTKNEVIEWNLIQIAQKTKKTIENYSYELLSNQKYGGFVDKYARKYNKTIKSPAEITRIAKAYYWNENFQLTNIEFVENSQLRDRAETYKLNTFVHDYIRDKTTKRNMILTFKATGKTSFISRDKLSFLIAEIQFFFPEFECFGILN